MQIWRMTVVVVPVEEEVFGILPFTDRWVFVPTLVASGPDHKTGPVVNCDFQLIFIASDEPTKKNNTSLHEP